MKRVTSLLALMLALGAQAQCEKTDPLTEPQFFPQPGECKLLEEMTPELKKQNPARYSDLEAFAIARRGYYNTLARELAPPQPDTLDQLQPLLEEKMEKDYCTWSRRWAESGARLVDSKRALGFLEADVNRAKRRESIIKKLGDSISSELRLEVATYCRVEAERRLQAATAAAKPVSRTQHF